MLFYEGNHKAGASGVSTLGIAIAILLTTLMALVVFTGVGGAKTGSTLPPITESLVHDAVPVPSITGPDGADQHQAVHVGETAAKTPAKTVARTAARVPATGSTAADLPADAKTPSSTGPTEGNNRQHGHKLTAPPSLAPPAPDSDSR